MDHPLPDASELARRLAATRQGAVEPGDLAVLMSEVDLLFTAHQDLVYATCLRFVGTPEHALDLAQDTMLRAYQKLPTFRGEARFSTWLVSIARYECLNARRKKRDLLSEDGLLDATEPARSALGRLRVQEREALLRDAAATVLDPVEQEAVFLRYTEHLDLRRIEEELGLTEASGARGLLQRCKRKLRAAIVARLEELGHGSSFVRGSRDE